MFSASHLGQEITSRCSSETYGVSWIKSALDFVRMLNPTVTPEVASCYNIVTGAIGGGYGFDNHMDEVPPEFEVQVRRYVFNKVADIVSSVNIVLHEIDERKIGFLPKRVISELKTFNPNVSSGNAIVNAATALKAAVVPTYIGSNNYNNRNRSSELKWDATHNCSLDMENNTEYEAIDCNLYEKIDKIRCLMHDTGYNVSGAYRTMSSEFGSRSGAMENRWSDNDGNLNNANALRCAFCDLADVMLYLYSISDNSYAVQSLRLPNIKDASLLIPQSLLTKDGAFKPLGRFSGHNLVAARAAMVSIMEPCAVACISENFGDSRIWEQLSCCLHKRLEASGRTNVRKVSTDLYNFAMHEIYRQNWAVERVASHKRRSCNHG